MDTIALHDDFREFLSLLNASEARYLLVGGYAVAFHGYPRVTLDLDVWIAPDAQNVARAAEVIRRFGFESGALADWEKNPAKILRMGYPPVRIEVFTSISGVSFDEAFAMRVQVPMDVTNINMIGLAELRANKRAAGRHKDLDDLEQLPPAP